MDLRITFNGEEYTLTYNKQSGYYEIELQAPNTGGVYNVDVEFTDLFGGEYEATKPIQVFAKEPIKIDTKKVFMWIFGHRDFKVKDIVELQEYELQVDEETNAKSIVRVLKETLAQSKDIVAIKDNSEVIYWGIIEQITNANGSIVYEYSLKYITNLFDTDVALHENINTDTVEDGYYRFHFVGDNKYVIDVANASLEDGANIWLYENNNTNAQKFQVIKRASHVVLKNVNSGKCIDVTGGDFQSRTNVEQWVDNDTAAQAFDFIKIKDYVYMIKSHNYNYAIDVANNIGQNGNNIMIYPSSVSDVAEHFHVERLYEFEMLVGVEDFIANTIKRNFTESSDTHENLDYLEIRVNTHTPIQPTVSNVENGIYNLHTWITNCNQLYDITYEFSIENSKLIMTIENKQYAKRLIDTKAMSISNYEEIFETDVVSKVVVLTNTNTYYLYLLNDRTTTTDPTDPSRAEGSTKTVYTENFEDAPQKALDEMKANSYEHNITFKLDEYIRQGTPIAIKTKNSLIYDTYISKVVRNSDNKFYEYTCGNIRTTLIDKIKQKEKI